MLKRIWVVGLACLCVFGLLGCETLGGKNKPTSGSATLEAQAMLKFSDVPVPVGFKMINEESYSFESSGVRVGVLRYYGKANVERVENFYKDQMPMYNWNFLNVVEYGERLMNFDRDTETCIISLLPKGNNVTINISLGPKSPARKKSDKPVK